MSTDPVHGAHWRCVLECAGLSVSVAQRRPHVLDCDRRAISMCRQLTIPPMSELLQGNVVLLDRERLKAKCDVAASTRLHLVPALHVDCIEDINIMDPEVMAHRSRARFTPALECIVRAVPSALCVTS